jgi:hypothetical protein
MSNSSDFNMRHPLLSATYCWTKHSHFIQLFGGLEIKPKYALFMENRKSTCHVELQTTAAATTLNEWLSIRQHVMKII